MTLRTLALYLFGNREAILALAADRRALWVSMLFVLSAGFARDYDGSDLLHEPWHLLIPFGASLAAATLLFLVTCGPIFFRKETRSPFGPAYRSFLTLFWMTAPLAWLYAVPYERFLPPGPATTANLWTLALVAAWRVVLMIRVVSVLTGRSTLDSLMLVMAVADGIALAAVAVSPFPVIDFMGGIRQSDSDAAINSATLLVFCSGLFSAPVWGIGGLVALIRGKPVWNVSTTAPFSSGRGVWILAVASVLIWLPILPFTQDEQILRTRVEKALTGGRIDEGLDLMSAHAPSDFPPHWNPPPRLVNFDTNPKLHDVLNRLATRDSAPWVRNRYVEYFRWKWVDRYFDYPQQGDELQAWVRFLRHAPEGPEWAVEFIQRMESRDEDRRKRTIGEDDWQTLKDLAGKAGQPDRK